MMLKVTLSSNGAMDSECDERLFLEVAYFASFPASGKPKTPPTLWFVAVKAIDASSAYFSTRIDQEVVPGNYIASTATETLTAPWVNSSADIWA